MQHKYKEGFMVGGIGALSFIAAYVFYKILLIVAKADLGNQAAIITFDHEFFSKLSNSFLGYIQLIKDLMNSNNYAIFFGLFTLLALIGIFNRSKKEKSLLTSLVNTSLIFLIFGAMFIITAGINLVVNTPKWFPRVMMGFPFLLLALAFLQENNTGWIRKFNRFTIILLLYFSVVLSAQYGTFLRNQDRFSEYIISLLAPKIAEHDNVKITSNGRIPYANQNKLLVAKFPLLRDLAPVYENGHWIWGLRSYNRYGMIEADYKFTPEKYDFQDMQLIDANKYYHLYYKDQLFVVDYKKESTANRKP